MPDVDVVVVGAGAAGLTAAVAAEEAGARVIVAEAEGVVGGAARLSGGIILAAGTDVQQAAQLDDDAESFYHDYMILNQYETPPGLVRRLTHDSGPTIAWLTELGVEFRPEVMQAGAERVPRGHVPAATRDRGRGGQYIVDALYRRCLRGGIELALGRRVDRLLVHQGTVVGVAVGDDEVSAAAVVLATGGFSANESLVAKHLPSFVRNAGDWAFYNGPDSSRGDGLVLGEQVGANVVGHDRYTALLTPHIDTNEFDAYLPAWMLVVGPDGRRILDETTPYGFLFGIADAAGGRVFGLFDAQIVADNGSPQLPTFKLEYPPGSPMAPQVWTPFGIEQMIASGTIVQAETPEGLAGQLELSADAITGTIRRYNNWALLGEDRDFGKHRRFLRPIESPPYYGVELRPAVLGFPHCGLAIDRDGRVIDGKSQEIEGLYAAGECAGGVLGCRYAGSGNSLLSSFVFGRTAGRSAAQYALMSDDSIDG